MGSSIRTARRCEMVRRWTRSRSLSSCPLLTAPPAFCLPFAGAVGSVQTPQGETETFSQSPLATPCHSRTCVRCLNCLLIDCVCRRRAFRATVQLPRRHSAAHLVGQHPNQWAQGRRHPAADHRRKLCEHRHPDMLVPPASGNVPRRLSERTSGSPRRVPRRGRLSSGKCHVAAQLRRSGAGAGVPVRPRHHHRVP